MRSRYVSLIFLVAACLSGCLLSRTGALDSFSSDIPVDTVKVLATTPHDPLAFTQGLAIEDGTLYESTGRRGESTLRRVDLKTGCVEQMIRLPDDVFGEGIAVWQDRIIQLTWDSHIGYVYNRKTFEKEAEFPVATEGWGLTEDGHRLIMSDGTAILRFLDPETFEEIGRIEVRDDQGPVMSLNELEFIRGEIWANVWQTDRIARIDPDSGRVRRWIDLADLLPPEGQTEEIDVLNGIAYDKGEEILYVTGKLWPELFEIEVVQGSSRQSGASVVP